MVVGVRDSHNNFGGGAQHPRDVRHCPARLPLRYASPLIFSIITVPALLRTGDSKVSVTFPAVLRTGDSSVPVTFPAVLRTGDSSVCTYVPPINSRWSNASTIVCDTCSHLSRRTSFGGFRCLQLCPAVLRTGDSSVYTYVPPYFARGTQKYQSHFPPYFVRGIQASTSLSRRTSYGGLESSSHISRRTSYGELKRYDYLGKSPDRRRSGGLSTPDGQMPQL